MNSRAERLLVRVLLLLRREARCSPDRAADARRAEQLADVILSDFPRRVLPLGMAALVVVVVLCAMPLIRDAGLPADGSSATVAHRVERSVRRHSSTVSEGFDALRAVVAPFTPAVVESAEVDEPSAPVPPKEAVAPFRKS